jgi:predicted DNA-binding antitoxin AbrB/MazE fold protein
MNRTVPAIYENGILRPLEPTGLQEQQAVTVTISAEAAALPETEQPESPKKTEGSAVAPPRDAADARPWRGVFAPTLERPVLFVKDMDLHPAALPSWQPQINVDRRRDADDAE